MNQSNLNYATRAALPALPEAGLHGRPAFRPRVMPSSPATTGPAGALHLVWAELEGWRRVAVVGLAAAALAFLAVAIQLTAGVREAIADGRSQLLRATVDEIEPALPDLSRRPLGEPAMQQLELLLADLFGDEHVHFNLWSLDGTLLYSDGAGVMTGRADPGPRLREAATSGAVSLLTDAALPGGVQGTPASRVVEHYIAVHEPATGDPVAVLESYEDIGYVDAALGRMDETSRVTLVAGLGMLGMAVTVLVGTAIGSSRRDRLLAEARGREFTMLSATADALASSLDPARLFSTLERRVTSGLGLERLAIVAPESPPVPGSVVLPLRDGQLLVAERDEPLSAEEARIVEAARNALDAAIANATLYEEVRRAAAERQRLIRNVAVAHEEERRRLVGELHDSLASDLIRTLYAVRRAEMIDPSSGDLPEVIAGIEGMVEDAERRLRAFLNAIRPAALEIESVSAAARDVVSRYAAESRLRVRVRVAGEPNRLHAAAQAVVIRALEEALLNIEKHAGATRVAVLLVGHPNEVLLAVSDDGVGWPPVVVTEDGRGFGLLYLRERVEAQGGSLTRGAGRRGGARLCIRLPITPVASG